MHMVVVVGGGGALALMPAPVHTCVDGCRKHVPLPGCGPGCGDSYSCQLGSNCQGSWVTESCDGLSDLGTPTQGLFPAALTLVPPVAFVCGLDSQVQGRGCLVRRLAWVPWSLKDVGISLCHLVDPYVLPFSPPCLPEMS